MKTKKRKPSEKQSQLPWEEVAESPLRLFHTFRGPVVGHETFGTPHVARVYAPAALIMPTPKNVLFQPLAFVEPYIDINRATLVGTSPVPDVIAEGYAGYFKQFAAGSYMMRPVVIAAEVPPSEAVETKIEEHPLEKCPACKQDVSNWQAHYPVLVEVSEEQTDIGRGGPTWFCEMDTPDIRERYPNYTPPRPQDVPQGQAG